MRFIFFSLLMIFCSAQIFGQNTIGSADKSVPVVEVLKKNGKEGSGTGFVIGLGGVVATNYHVIKNAKEVFLFIRRPDGEIKPIPATVIWTSPEKDLALLSAPQLERPALQIYSPLPSKGAEVFSIGYPGAADDFRSKRVLESTLSQGIVGRIFQGEISFNGPMIDIVQHSAPINRGNSGGPLLDPCGRVLGVNTSTTLGKIVGNSDTGPLVVQTAGIGFASHISNLISGLKETNTIYSVTDSVCVKGAPGSIADANSVKSWVTPLIIAAASCIALLALFFSLRKSKVIRETFTQYKRRSSQAKPRPSNESNQRDRGAKWLLKGSESNGRNISLSLDSSALNYGNVTIGRDSSVCQLVIDDTSVSREHASFSLSAERLMIKDLGSKNGTWIDGEKVGNQPVTIRLGQTITLGKVKLRVDGVRS